MIVDVIVKRCCTTKEAEKETYYLLFYLIDKCSGIEKYLEEINKVSGILTIKGLHKLLMEEYPYEMKDFTKHIQVKKYLSTLNE